VVDPATGAFVLDSSGNKTYANKAIVTPLNQSNSSELQANSIALGGDLLQFDPARFATEKAAGLNMGAQNNTSGTVNGVPARAQNWVKVALDPNKTTAGKPDPERSKNSDHVLGLITLDIWMKGPTTGGSTNMNKTGNNGRKLTGGDGISDTYFVALAGKTELATSGPDAGKPLVIAGDTKTSGGLGTWRQHRDNLSDNMGEFRVIGGVIQGTVGKNHFDPGSNDTHNWLDSGGSVGYSLDMFYDIEATRQRVFPVQADFSVVRFLETPARAG
jgi:hypothetical protein